MIAKENYRFLRNLDDFRLLPIDQFDELALHIKKRKVPKEHILFFEGDVRDKLYIVVSGYVRIEHSDTLGTFTYTDFITSHNIFPYEGLFEDEVYRFSAQAMTDVEYFCVPTKLFEEFSATSVYQMKHLYVGLSRLLRLHELRVRNVVTSSASMRVEQSLAFLLKELGEVDSHLPIALTTSDVAAISGTTRETVSRVFRDLKKKHLIAIDHKYIVFLDRDYFLKFLR
ncbi:MAG: Crp/Fnr family transcriptional regulator [Streptococcus hyointestinalis]|nr:Crp/Fnr family transcriptional regulator [Streptococcus hyointestinalis]MDD6384595.1 Crp/Fnr family transcriptional regulator [Streptococcus hyointestinalis]